MDCCGIDTVSGAPAGSGGAAASALRQFEIDFTAQGARALATGAENFTTTDGDALSWTVFIAALDAWSVGAVNGLVYVAGATSTVALGSGITATNMQIPLSSIYTLLDIDATWRFRIDWYFTLQTINSNTAATRGGLFAPAGFPDGSSSRMSAGGRAFLSATEAWVGLTDVTASFVNNTAFAASTNVTGITAVSSSVTAHAGVWNGTWDATRMVLSVPIGRQAATTPAQPVHDQEMNVVLAHATGGVAAAMRVNTERMRFQAMPFAA